MRKKWEEGELEIPALDKLIEELREIKKDLEVEKEKLKERKKRQEAEENGEAEESEYG